MPPRISRKSQVDKSQVRRVAGLERLVPHVQLARRECQVGTRGPGDYSGVTGTFLAKIATPSRPPSVEKIEPTNSMMQRKKNWNRMVPASPKPPEFPAFSSTSRTSGGTDAPISSARC